MKQFLSVRSNGRVGGMCRDLGHGFESKAGGTRQGKACELTVPAAFRGPAVVCVTTERGVKIVKILL